PIVAGTPQVAQAAFMKEADYFAREGVEYVSEALNFRLPHLLRRQLLGTWGGPLGITEDENDRACEQAWAALNVCERELQRRGLELLAEAERANDIVLLMLARPYHVDPGINHKVFEEFQALGYPVMSIRSIPKDPGWLARYFEDDLRAGRIADVFDVRDVWPENFSVNSAQKVWAAKFAARHPNVAVVDLSSFKCGNDAPVYGLVDSIISATRTPYLALHDLDANKPGTSIRIRVKTFAYTLELYRRELAIRAASRSELEKRLTARRAELVERYRTELEHGIAAKPGEASAGLAEAFDAYLSGEDVDPDEEAEDRHVA
ncbi:MAG TPA: CoA activase, partial [Alphaproteobacteria bacterium]|nr:CoA activase [Alphaproteobacteria bacterium]